MISDEKWEAVIHDFVNGCFELFYPCLPCTRKKTNINDASVDLAFSSFSLYPNQYPFTFTYQLPQSFL